MTLCLQRYATEQKRPGGSELQRPPYQTDPLTTPAQLPHLKHKNLQNPAGVFLIFQTETEPPPITASLLPTRLGGGELGGTQPEDEQIPLRA